MKFSLSLYIYIYIYIWNECLWFFGPVSLLDMCTLFILRLLDNHIIELVAKLIVDLLQKEEGHQNCIDALVSDCKSELRPFLWFKFSIAIVRRINAPTLLLEGETCFPKILLFS